MVGGGVDFIKEDEIMSVSLKPGETKKVIFTIDEKMLQFYSANNTWESEAGDFNV